MDTSNRLVRFTDLGEVALTLAMPPAAGNATTAVSGDSAGYLWGIAASLGQVCRFNLLARDPQASRLCWNASNVAFGRLNLVSSDFLGASRALLRRQTVAVVPPGDDALAAFDTAVESWSRRWGQIRYDVEEPGGSAVEVFVYLSDFRDGFPPVNSARWIPVDDRHGARDTFNGRIGDSPAVTAAQFPLPGEIVGRYLKLKVVQRVGRDGAPPRIANLRITCRDEAGRNLCQ